MSCSRREFLQVIQASLVAGGAGAIGLPLSACGPATGSTDATVAVVGGVATLTFAQFPALKSAGGGVVVQAGNAPIAVIRTGPTTAVALSAICTHEGCTVGWQQSTDNLFCGCHGSAFSTTGAVTNGPARQPLTQFASKLNADSIAVTVA
jgi:cytochrome b6-f complex iron-sulfur subunit